MKKLTLVLLSGLFIFGVYAQPLNVAEGPKLLNYKEFVSSINYPQICKENGLEGRVVVLLKVDESGKVAGFEFGPSPCIGLTSAVQKQLVNLKFTPAQNSKGEAIAGQIALPVNFKLTI